MAQRRPEHQAGRVRPVQIVFDATDTRTLETFLGGGARRARLPDTDSPDGAPDWPTWLAAQGVPEQNWYAGIAIEAEGDTTAPVSRPRGRGADRARCHVVGEITEHGVHWAVVLDPEGNEFCA